VPTAFRGGKHKVGDCPVSPTSAPQRTADSLARSRYGTLSISRNRQVPVQTWQPPRSETNGSLRHVATAAVAFRMGWKMPAPRKTEELSFVALSIR
jgi:hypothetical protein